MQNKNSFHLIHFLYYIYIPLSAHKTTPTKSCLCLKRSQAISCCSSSSFGGRPLLTWSMRPKSVSSKQTPIPWLRHTFSFLNWTKNAFCKNFDLSQRATAHHHLVSPPPQRGRKTWLLFRKRLMVPNPDDPDGPYIRRDGLSNPGNFNEHRESLRQMSIFFVTKLQRVCEN